MKKKIKKIVNLGAVEKVPVKSKLPYHLEVKVNDIEFKTDAKDLETALTKFVESPVFPLGAKTIAIIKYSKGENEMMRVLHTPEARRTFNAISLKPSYLAVFAAKLEEGLK
ncbi:MAG: hypothetical protein AAB706_01515 [Patescibacteria group bacterium]